MLKSPPKDPWALSSHNLSLKPYCPRLAREAQKYKAEVQEMVCSCDPRLFFFERGAQSWGSEPSAASRVAVDLNTERVDPFLRGPTLPTKCI